MHLMCVTAPTILQGANGGSWLRAVVDLFLTDLLSGLRSVVHFILSLNVQTLSELLTVVN